MLGTNRNISVIEIANLFKHEIIYIPEKPGERLASTIPDLSSQEELGYKAEKRIEDYIEQFLKEKIRGRVSPLIIYRLN